MTHCADQRIAALSGGERRRVSVALQLVTSPKVIFLDEPTSGLDADNALRLCQALRHMADTSGVAVVMTIHQPSDEIFRVSVVSFTESLRIRMHLNADCDPPFSTDLLRSLPPPCRGSDGIFRPGL